MKIQPNTSGGLNDHINRRISHSGSKAQYNTRGILEIMISRILVFMWSLEALTSLA